MSQYHVHHYHHIVPASDPWANYDPSAWRRNQPHPRHRHRGAMGCGPHLGPPLPLPGNLTGGSGKLCGNLSYQHGSHTFPCSDAPRVPCEMNICVRDLSDVNGPFKLAPAEALKACSDFATQCGGCTI